MRTPVPIRDVERETVVQSECIPRKITKEEWAKYWPDEPYPETFAKTSSRKGIANKRRAWASGGKPGA